MTRVYICHTYYHVYVSLLKELNNDNDKNIKTDIVLSKMSTNFKNLRTHLEKSGIFNNVFEMDERNANELLGGEINRYSSSNLLVKLIWQIKSTRLIAKRLCKFIDIDFSKYDEIFVYVDGDPIGHYLNYKKIKYCAVEDSLDIMKYYDSFRDQKYFRLKRILASLGLIFMGYGFSRYAVGMEVNDRKLSYSPKKKTIELSRKMLVENLNEHDRMLIYNIFMSEYKINSNKTTSGKTAILVAQSFYPEIIEQIDQQIRLYRDLINKYCEGFIIYIKPHPRDIFDYGQYFKDCIILEKYFPIEVLNFSDKLYFDRAITVNSASIDAINFVGEKIIVGPEFLDKYKQ